MIDHFHNCESFDIILHIVMNLSTLLAQ